jgi:hypothetical protein
VNVRPDGDVDTSNSPLVRPDLRLKRRDQKTDNAPSVAPDAPERGRLTAAQVAELFELRRQDATQWTYAISHFCSC